MKGHDVSAGFLEPPSGELDAILRDQRQRWTRGERVLVEHYLSTMPSVTNDAERLLDLIYGEIVCRQEAGERPELEEFVGRFPELAAAIRDQFAVEELINSADLAAPGPAITDNESTVVCNTVPEVSPSAERPPLRSFGAYKLISQVGQGGMGVAYKVRHATLNRIVALKTILAGPHASYDQRLRFRAEAEAVARLQNQHIVQVYEVGEFDGIPFLALEFVSGGNLATLVEAGPVPPRRAAELVERLALAIDDAHRSGVIHRDLKPANILLTPDGVPKITDFGLARLVDGNSRQTATGDVLGTPSYMAPEQASGDRTEGKAADVYALGAILYELLCGRCAFKAATPLETLSLVRSHEPEPPRRIRPSVPRDLETIVLTCLRKDPARRYKSARALADDVRHYLDGRPVDARPTPFWERGWKWIRRHPTATAAVMIGLAGMAGVLVMRTFANERLRNERAAKEQLIFRHLDSVDQVFISLGADKLMNVPHMTPHCKQLLLAAETELTSLSREPTSDVEIRLRLADSHVRIADSYRRIGDPKRAENQAEAVLATLGAVSPSSPKALRMIVARAYRLKALLLRDEKRLEDGLRAIDRAVLLLRPAQGDAAVAAPADVRMALANCVFVRAWILKDLNRIDDAEQQFFESLALDRSLRDSNPAAQREEARVNHFLGWLYADQRRYEQADEYYREAEKLREELVRESPDVASRRIDLGYSYNNRAVFTRARNREIEARAAVVRNLNHWKAILADFPDVPEFRSIYALALIHLAELEIKSSPEKAFDLLKESIANQQKALEPNPRYFEYQERLKTAQSLLAQAFLRLAY